MRRPTFSELVASLEPEAQAMRANVCPCCGSDKQPGRLLCPQCYAVETPTGLVPFAYSGMTFDDWITTAHHEQNARAV